jgi:hypothetical protein
VVEVVQSEVIENVATRDYVGEQLALVRKELAEQIGAVRQELAAQRCGPTGARGADRCGPTGSCQETGSIRQELARQIGDTRAELMGAINRLTFWMNGFLAALLVAVLGLCGILIGKL